MRYKITCKECKSSSTVQIENNRILWPKDTKIISGRLRLDGNWGWECICGQYDIITAQEKRQIKNLQAPSPQDISSVLKNLKPENPKFAMEKV